jgi:hypoxanthine phosphoribosyltransferase
MAGREQSLLHDADSLRQRVQSLAQQIDVDSQGVDGLVVIGVLDGSFVFVADLVRAMRTPCRVKFVKISSYRDGTRPGESRLLVDDIGEIAGAHLLLVDDILDSGRTLEFLREHLASQGVSSCRSCVLIRRSASEGNADYVGFEIGPGWVVGYGMDLDGRLRDLPYLAVLR